MDNEMHATQSESARKRALSPRAATAPAPKRPISIRKLEANRSNALRSTGPRTEEGKDTSRWNALKHGLLAREIVLPAGLGGEDPAEFHHLLAQLREHLAPSGVLEEILVEKIAACYWRLGRALRAEVAEVQKEIDDAPTARFTNAKLLEMMGHPVEIAPEEESRRLESLRVYSSLPTDDAVNKILRYETSVERQLYRALHQLERVQRRKQGENIPPPATIEPVGA